MPNCRACNSGAVVRTEQKDRVRMTCTVCGRYWFVKPMKKPVEEPYWVKQ